MAQVSFSRHTVLEYVPEADRNLPAAEQMVVHMHFVPGYDDKSGGNSVEKYGKIGATQVLEALQGVKNDIRKIEVRTSVLRKLQRRQFVENVERIENYSVDGKPVQDGGEFYDTAAEGLIIEIIRAMEDSQKLDEGQRKNWQGASATA